MNERLRRRGDWLRRLSDYLAACEGLRFARGRFDCALFACDWVREATGVDVAADYRGRYDTRAGAARRLKEIDGGGLYEAACRAFGAPLAAPLMARRGDVVLCEVKGPDGPSSPALGVVDATGVEIALVAPDRGLIRAPLIAARAAWAVG